MLAVTMIVGVALASQVITARTPPKVNRKVRYPSDKQLYRQRHKIENLFGQVARSPGDARRREKGVRSAGGRE